MNNEFTIPFVDFKKHDDASFLIRPVLSDIDPVKLEEKPHRHSYQEIIWISSGKGKHVIDDRLVHLKPRTFYLIGQGQVHNFIEGKNLKGFLIRFKNDFLPFVDINTGAMFNAVLVNQITKIDEITIYKEELAGYEAIMKQMHSEYQMSNELFGKNDIIQHLLIALLIKIERKIREISTSLVEATEDWERQIYHRMILLIENNFKKQHLIEFYAHQLGVSQRKLSRVSKNFSSKSIKQLITERLITEAKRLLIFTTFSLKEITYELGYDDPAYFNRFFKNHAGCTPKKYKEKIKE